MRRNNANRIDCSGGVVLARWRGLGILSLARLESGEPDRPAQESAFGTSETRPRGDTARLGIRALRASRVRLPNAG